MLPSPVRADGERGSRAYKRGNPTLRGAALLLTPTANLGSNGGSQDPEKRRSGGHGPTLADQVEHLLPIPSASNPNDGEFPDQWQARHDLHARKADRPTWSGMPLGIAVQKIAPA